jgi:hypothetical protein
MFQQLHASMIDATTPKVKPYIYGLAIGFMTTVFTLTKQLETEKRLDAQTKNAQLKVIDDAIKAGQLTIEASYVNESLESVYRHVRNCFAHGNWSYDDSVSLTSSRLIQIDDFDPDQKNKQTFAATIEFHNLVDMAERLLIDTFKGMP